MLVKIYNKCLEWAAHKRSNFFLALVSFSESSFFPLPPDIMIIPMVIAKKKNYIKIFLIATLFSTLGGLLGYFIGSYFIDVALKIVEIYGYQEKIIDLKNNLSSGNSLYVWLGTLFIAGFTPLPFKIFTITSGIIGVNLIIFFFICLLARGLRFYIIAYFSAKFEKKFNSFIEKKGTKWFPIIGLLIVVIFTIIYFFFN